MYRSWSSTQTETRWGWYRFLNKTLCIYYLPANPTDLHPTYPHHCSYHGSTGCWPSGPADALWGPSGHGPGPTRCPGPILRHAPPTAAAAAVVPSTYEPCDAQDKYGGCTGGTDWRAHTGTNTHPQYTHCVGGIVTVLVTFYFRSL